MARKGVKSTNPCDLKCSKCGSSDIHRVYRKKGETWNLYGPTYDTVANTETPHISYSNHSAQVKLECIVHICRCCSYQWDSDVRIRNDKYDDELRKFMKSPSEVMKEVSDEIKKEFAGINMKAVVIESDKKSNKKRKG